MAQDLLVRAYVEMLYKAGAKNWQLAYVIIRAGVDPTKFVKAARQYLDYLEAYAKGECDIMGRSKIHNFDFKTPLFEKVRKKRKSKYVKVADRKKVDDATN